MTSPAWFFRICLLKWRTAIPSVKYFISNIQGKGKVFFFYFFSFLSRGRRGKFWSWWLFKLNENGSNSDLIYGCENFVFLVIFHLFNNTILAWWKICIFCHPLVTTPLGSTIRYSIINIIMRHDKLLNPFNVSSITGYWCSYWRICTLILSHTFTNHFSALISSLTYLYVVVPIVCILNNTNPKRGNICEHPSTLLRFFTLIF